MGQLRPDVLTPGVVTITTTPTLIVAANSARRSLLLTANESVTGVDVTLGNSAIVAGQGPLLPAVKGASVRLDTSGAVYGVVGSSEADVGYLEFS